MPSTASRLLAVLLLAAAARAAVGSIQDARHDSSDGDQQRTALAAATRRPRIIPPPPPDYTALQQQQQEATAVFRVKLGLRPCQCLNGGLCQRRERRCACLLGYEGANCERRDEQLFKLHDQAPTVSPSSTTTMTSSVPPASPVPSTPAPPRSSTMTASEIVKWAKFAEMLAALALLWVMLVCVCWMSSAEDDAETKPQLPDDVFVVAPDFKLPPLRTRPLPPAYSALEPPPPTYAQCTTAAKQHQVQHAPEREHNACDGKVDDCGSNA